MPTAMHAGHDHGCGCSGCCAAPARASSIAPDAVPAAPIIGADGATAGMSAATVAALQRAVGNAAVASLMRSPKGPVLARRGFFGGAENETEEYEDAIEEKTEYVGDGVRGPEDFQSSTGIGGFEVAYDPGSMVLDIALRGSVSFIDGIAMLGPFAFALQPNEGGAAAAINLMAADQRAAAAAGWQWDDTARGLFLARFEAVVMSIWNTTHKFHCSKQWWEDLGATPTVTARVHAGDKTDDDHMAMTVYKVPPNFQGPVGVVNSGGGGIFGGAATDNTMTLNSVDVEQRTDDILNVTTAFAPGTANLDPSQNLTQFAIRFRSGGPVCGMCGSAIEAVGGVAISATIQGDGADPEQNARDRFASLTAALVAGGMTDAATRLQFAYGGVGTSGQLKVGDGVPQIVAAHEAGHMFGLGDRYATTAGAGIGGTGPSVGLPSRHDDLAKGGGLEGAKAANDDGIMAWGNQVRPADMATFVEALKYISEMEEWVFGPPQIVVAPVPADAKGDFPTPTPGENAMA